MPAIGANTFYIPMYNANENSVSGFSCLDATFINVSPLTFVAAVSISGAQNPVYTVYTFRRNY